MKNLSEIKELTRIIENLKVNRNVSCTNNDITLKKAYDNALIALLALIGILQNKRWNNEHRKVYARGVVGFRNG